MLKAKIKRRVVVAMSGGVDSSVAAAILKKQGFDVIGITMCFKLQQVSAKRPRCCGPLDIEDARRVAAKLRIRHYVINLGRELENKVIRDFCIEYTKGRTPNPCIRCNQYIKFDTLLKKAKQLNADYLATGHFARIAYSKRKKHFLLKKAKDLKKDQSYFLYTLSQNQLKNLLFPIGVHTKNKVRKIARDLNLPTAEKPASQEICFITDADYRGFLKRRLPQILAKGGLAFGENSAIKPGKIVDTQGNVIGEHKGIAFYTIGQRKGIGIAQRDPLYIVSIDAAKNLIVAGKKKDLKSYGLIADNLNPTGIDSLLKPVSLKAKIRYNHREIASKIFPLSNKEIKVVFKVPQQAVTPGQAVVFYRKDYLIGGGIIKEGLNEKYN